MPRKAQPLTVDDVNRVLAALRLKTTGLAHEIDGQLVRYLPAGSAPARLLDDVPLGFGRSKLEQAIALLSRAGLLQPGNRPKGRYVVFSCEFTQEDMPRAR